jgi:enediyne biosynthesis protein E4
MPWLLNRGPRRFRLLPLPSVHLLPSTTAFALAVALAACDGAAPTPPAAPTPTPSPPSGPYFVDATAETGLDFVHFNGMSGQHYILEMMGPGAALFDYDGDGDLDLLLRQGAPLGGAKAPGRPLGDRLYRNDLTVGADGSRHEHWTDVTAGSGIAGPGYGLGVATGDFDGDGRIDVYLTNYGHNRLLRNRGDGTFEDVTAKSGTDDDRWSAAATFFDFDRDGRLDLFIGNYVDFSPANHHPCFRASSAPDYCGPMSYRQQPDRLLRNRGDGTFEDVTARARLAGTYGSALGAVAFDADGDGWPDLFVANDAMENQLWINRRDGTFADEAVLRGVAVNGDGERQGNMGIAVGDFDRDGDLDLFVTHMATETNTLWVEDGGGTFHDGTLLAGLASPSRTATGFGTAFLDVDNDGLLDLLAVDGAVRVIPEQERAGDPLPLRQTDKLYRNLGGGRFADVTAAAGAPFTVAAVGRGAAFGDVDNDGDVDLVETDNDGPARLLLNQVGQDRPWLGLRLVGGRPPRDQLGAVVTVFRAHGPALVRRAASDGSYLSANDPRVLVGLGDDAEVTRVRVRWPDGKVEDFHGLPLRSYSTLSEGAGEPAAGDGAPRDRR